MCEDDVDRRLELGLRVRAKERLPEHELYELVFLLMADAECAQREAGAMNRHLGQRNVTIEKLREVAGSVAELAAAGASRTAYLAGKERAVKIVCDVCADEAVARALSVAIRKDGDVMPVAR